MNDFSFLNLKIVEALQIENITVPTEVQALVIPLVLQNKDLIVQSQTGTGKTLAFLIPLFAKLQPLKRETQAIILVPTHELAIQIQRQIERLTLNTGIKIVGLPIIGNVNILRQIEKLREKPQIIVGSPGRILELIQKKKISAHTVKTLIVDEADKMMDKSNFNVVKALIKTTLRDRQLLFFSASISNDTIEKAKLLMKEPELIKLENTMTIPTSIEHSFYVTEERDKIETLVKLARILNPSKSMVFINKEFENEVAVEKLKYCGLAAGNIYGGNNKFQRELALDNFKKGNLQFLIASDIAARGLQVDGITCIFNISMPEDPLDYLHRVGRTGRNGKQGQAISIITTREQQLIKVYENKFKIRIQGKKMFQGRVFDLNSFGSQK
jgi:superfamily II DNA/RNA helicase